MTYLQDLINPPPTEGDIDQHYQFFNNVYDTLNGMIYIPAPSVVMNADFNTLSGAGLTPTTQADGDDFEFIGDWFVFGASNANYILSPTAYPDDSTVKSSSLYFFNATVTSFNNGEFYFYQRQNTTVRKYQKDYLTYGLQINNNQDKAISVLPEIFSYYGGDSVLKTGKTIYLQPGINKISSTILTQSLSGANVNSGNYTDFRFKFIDLIDGTADLDFYQIKCEFGQISTPLP